MDGYTFGRRLLVPGWGREYTLVLSRDATAEEAAGALRPLAAAQVCEELFHGDDVLTRGTVVRLLEGAGAVMSPFGELSARELSEQAARLAKFGALLVLAEATPLREYGPAQGGARAGAVVAAALSQAPEVHAWLEVEVVDEAGNPSTGAKVRVLHQGAVVATGSVGKAPLLRFDGLPEAERYDVEVEPPRHAA